MLRDCERDALKRLLKEPLTSEMLLSGLSDYHNIMVEEADERLKKVLGRGSSGSMNNSIDRYHLGRLE